MPTEISEVVQLGPYLSSNEAYYLKLANYYRLLNERHNIDVADCLDTAGFKKKSLKTKLIEAF